MPDVDGDGIDGTAPNKHMRAISVRFGAEQLDFIQQEAAAEGQSGGAFIRESAFARALLLNLRRKGIDTAFMNALAEFAHEYGSESLQQHMLDFEESVKRHGGHDQTPRRKRA